MVQPRAVTGHSGCISHYVGHFFGKTRRVASRRHALAPARGFSAIQAGTGRPRWDRCMVRAELRARRGAAQRVERPPEESASAAFRGTNEDDRAERAPARARARALAPSITADRVSRTMNESLASLSRRKPARRENGRRYAAPRRAAPGRQGHRKRPAARARRAAPILSRPDIREPARIIP